MSHDRFLAGRCGIRGPIRLTKPDTRCTRVRFEAVGRLGRSFYRCRYSFFPETPKRDLMLICLIIQSRCEIRLKGRMESRLRSHEI
jgi:hypothetical protein